MIAGARDVSSSVDHGPARHLARIDRQYRDDLDRFDASATAANTAYAHDAHTLQDTGYTVTVELQCPGFATARVAAGRETTTIDWAHASAWRFRPLVRLDGGGVMLHPIEVAINMLLLLATRREPQDLLDVLEAGARLLPFPALAWNVFEKHSSLNPASYLALCRRRTLTPEDAAAFRATGSVDVAEASAR